MKLSVFAVIVTFNRPRELNRCIESLLTQVVFGLTRIHVVVNSNDQQTQDILASYLGTEILTYELHNNPGPAGGFGIGLKRFLSEQESHVWLMDDDVLVKDNCLENLLTCADKSHFICPIVLSESGKRLGKYGWWGVLLSRPIVEKAGLPISDLFFWIEDTEYLQHRIGRVFGSPPFRCESAIVTHLHQRSKRHPAWYYYYVVRNTIFYRLHIVPFTWRRVRRTLVLIPGLLVKILLSERRKIHKLKMMFYGIYHGLIGKIGKLVDPSKNR